MDRSQLFIKNCLLTRNFADPEKLIKENRLQDTLLLLPTDGGVSTRLKRNRSKLKISLNTLEKAANTSRKHKDYKRVNKNSKAALKNYINNCKSSAGKALHIAYDSKITDKNELSEHLQNNHTELWEALPRFDTFLPMHEQLWVGYIRELLNVPTTLSDASKLNINGSSALMKLSMADYNGAFLKVASSQNENQVGIEGIVLWDSQKNFIMLCRGNLVDEVKIIPKKGTVFNFEVPLNADDALSYTILGDRFKYRSSDRAGRKFKSRRCDDMLHYLVK